jgi:NADPH:quinone reductase-like Zn-dependent oxidoreductase
MKAARVLRFGPPSVIQIDEVPRPKPSAGELLVRVEAAGTGNWDTLIREGKVELQPLPLILGSELSGVVKALGAGVAGFEVGDQVYGATNEQFSGAHAEYAVPLAGMMARKPAALSFIEAASVPIAAVTAWQMLHDYAQVTPGQSLLIHGAAGNVGSYAIQLVRRAGLHVIASVAADDMNYVKRLGADRMLNYQTMRFEESLTGLDAVLDTVGGDTLLRSPQVLKPGGILVSSVSRVPEAVQNAYGIRAAYFYVGVTTARLNKLTELFKDRSLATAVGTVLSLKDARIAHEMLAESGHRCGKIVLTIGAQLAEG